MKKTLNFLVALWCLAGVAGVIMAWTKGSLGFESGSGAEVMGYNLQILLGYTLYPYLLYKILKSEKKTI